jgi:hypothetical protein
MFVFWFSRGIPIYPQRRRSSPMSIPPWGGVVWEELEGSFPMDKVVIFEGINP